MLTEVSVIITANTSWYVYNFRKNTILHFLELGCKVLVVSPYDPYADKLIAIGCEFIHIKIDSKGINPINDVILFFRFYSIFLKKKPNVVLNFTPKNNIYSTLAASLLNIKVVNNIAGLGSVFIKNGMVSQIVKVLYKISQPKAGMIFFQNEEDRHLFLRHNLVDRAKTERIPGSGVDISRFTVRLAPDDGIVRFLLVARMLYEKGILHYVEAARYFRNKYGDKVEFRLLGFLDVDNPSAISCEQMNNWEDEGCIQYLGVSDKVEDEIGFVDCVVLPSYYREGVPKSLLEAAAMGKPIVTTNNVGCRETVSHGVNGYLCQPRSTESLIESLELIIGMSHQDRTDMGMKSRNKAESEFDEKIVIGQYVDTIKKLLSGPN
ncbi:glycosyltransferase family 4 protein [Musicola keenii]|uniref:glycosyltransferase family 4 protein n=1 Tax=Musicola keenii TaxID=2884250 RepID=UPI001786BB7F|nr:glycosyltransferase family 4 protein [Musicola keenii]